MNLYGVYDRINRSGKRDGLYKDNLLLRGCTIRNTEEAVGMVIYAGTQTRTGNVHTVISTTFQIIYCLTTNNSALISK